MPKLLELFSGTGSVGRAFEALGWDVISLDIDPKANATYCCDIMDFDWRSIGPVDVISSFPSCTKYSVARTKGPEDDLQSSDALVRKTLEIAEALGSPPFFLRKPLRGPAQEPGHNRIANAKSRLLCLWLPLPQANCSVDQHRLDTS